MLIFADIYDALGQHKLGDGPITAITAVKIVDKLDALRTFTVSVKALDYRSYALLTPGNQIRVMMQLDTGVQTIAIGYIEKYVVKDKLTGTSVKLTCRDLLSDLLHINTRLNRVYNDVPISTIVNDLVSLAGWTATVDSGLGNATITFNGLTVLRAFQDLAEATGLHFRRGTANDVEFGALGASTDLRLVQPLRLPREIYSNPSVAFVNDIKNESNSDVIVNWVLPLGNKSDSGSRVTLEHATINSPYTVRNAVGPDGSTYYYLQDTPSISAYGSREMVAVFDEITAVGTAPADLEAASNQLYTQAAALLGRFASPETRYVVNVVHTWERIPKIGDKVTLAYKGVARQYGTPDFTYIDADGLYWVVEQTIKLDDTGLNLKLTLSSRDVVPVGDPATIVAQAIANYQRGLI